MILQISSGQGPVECEIAVREIVKCCGLKVEPV